MWGGPGRKHDAAGWVKHDIFLRRTAVRGLPAAPEV